MSQGTKDLWNLQIICSYAFMSVSYTIATRGGALGTRSTRTGIRSAAISLKHINACFHACISELVATIAGRLPNLDGPYKHIALLSPHISSEPRLLLLYGDCTKLLVGCTH